MKLIKAFSVMTCALLLHANAQADILIDDFSTIQGPVSDTVVGPGAGVGTDGVTPNTNYNQTNSFGGDILGSYRDIYVEETDNGVAEVGDDDSLGIHAQVSGGRFSASLDNLAKGFAVVTYDGMNEVGSDWAGNVDVDGLAVGGVGQDWSVPFYFLFEDVSNDLIAPVQLTVWTEDAPGIFTAHTAEFLTAGLSGEAQEGIVLKNIRTADDRITLYDTEIYLSLFGDGYINWASVGAFQAVFNLDNSLSDSVLDVDLSLSRAVLPVHIPEPAALSMFGAGILMLGFMGTRRRNNKEQ